MLRTAQSRSSQSSVSNNWSNIRLVYDLFPFLLELIRPSLAPCAHPKRYSRLYCSWGQKTMSTSCPNSLMKIKVARETKNRSSKIQEAQVSSRRRSSSRNPQRLEPNWLDRWEADQRPWLILSAWSTTTYYQPINKISLDRKPVSSRRRLFKFFIFFNFLFITRIRLLCATAGIVTLRNNCTIELYIIISTTIYSPSIGTVYFLQLGQYTKMLIVDYHLSTLF